MKMPDPTIPPITSIVAPKSPISRARAPPGPADAERACGAGEELVTTYSGEHALATERHLPPVRAMSSMQRLSMASGQTWTQ